MKPFDFPFGANGEEYVLKYTFQARRSFEQKYKMSVPGLLRSMSEVETQTAEHMIKVFQLLLMTDKPNITDDEVEKIIVDLGGEDAAMEVLTKAISTQVGDTEDRP